MEAQNSLAHNATAAAAATAACLSKKSMKLSSPTRRHPAVKTSSSSSHPGPGPGPGPSSPSSPISSSSSSSRQLLILLTFLIYISLSSASPTIYIDEQLVDGQLGVAPQFGVQGTNTSPASELLGSTILDHLGADDLKRRAEETDANLSFSSSSSSSSISSISTRRLSSSSTLAPTTTPDGIVAAETTSVQPLPVPFDMGFNNNITSNCASFMSSMLSNSTFTQCLPFSLLLQNSNSFFQASKSLVRITQTLDHSCAANVTSCTSVLSSFATNIGAPTACASDLSSENPLIQQAVLGLQAYKPLYTASCLRDPSTSAYCFADAITNTSNPSGSYIYFLPLNTSLVGGSQPTCDACLQDTMAVFEAASAERTQALASTYVGAARQVNVNCGPQFVNASLALAVTSAAVSSLQASPPGSIGLTALLAVLMTWLL